MKKRNWTPEERAAFAARKARGDVVEQKLRERATRGLEIRPDQYEDYFAKLEARVSRRLGAGLPG
jgi:hypothetical protein